MSLDNMICLVQVSNLLLLKFTIIKCKRKVGEKMRKLVKIKEKDLMTYFFSIILFSKLFHLLTEGDPLKSIFIFTKKAKNVFLKELP